MVEVAESQRDRAMLFVLYESGARAGELLSLRLKDAEIDELVYKLYEITEPEKKIIESDLG